MSAMNDFDVIVIGAGWAGLSAAARLSQAGLKVRVLDKGRGAGGRSSTRRQGGFSFDHGAQYFTARSDRFRLQVERWREQSLVAAWKPRIQVFGERPQSTGGSPDERLVAVPGMNGVPARLAASLDCQFGQRVAALYYFGRWQIELEEGAPISSRALVLTAPPAQAIELLGADHALSATLASVRLQPTVALMAGFDRLRDPGFDAAFDNEGPLSWLASNSSKPGRDPALAWVAHASSAWSEAHLERSPNQVSAELSEALCRRLNVDPATISLATVHRWRYAQCDAPLDQGCLWQADQSLAVAGDWCAGNRIEGAWLSGQAAADRLLGTGR